MGETITEEAFAAEARAFLSANAKPKAEEVRTAWGEGSDDVALFPEKEPEGELREVEESKAWRQLCFDNGFGWVTGPTEWGGRGLHGRYESIWQGLQAQYETPSNSPFGIGLGMVAPTFLAHGSQRVKELYVRQLWRGEIVGCQLFSEPGAGSDLASVQTRAERDGDEWILNGQKVWTSGAQYSDVGEVITRTDPSLPKHKGLTMFAVDMHAPGVEVRPLRQMTGGASFNEVYFTDVRVPADHLLEAENMGWTVALTTLMNERASIGGGGGGGGNRSTDRLAEMLRHFGLQDNGVLRDELTRILINSRVAGYTNQRAAAKMKAGQLPGPEMSIGKLALTNNLTAMSAFVSKVLGMRITADTGEWGTYAWAEYVLGTPGMRIAGGSDEVMRNIVGERVLGLPKEPPVDR